MTDQQKTRPPFVATAAIKLVVWDMDDTFWHGTLSEEGVALIDHNVALVKTLAERGIVSSIASKNDFDAVKEVLEANGIWDYFIFPQISWASKGNSLETIIEQANLRADNILFIDDNMLNIEEIRFRFPAMMVAHPDDVLHLLLDLDQAKGKDDPGLSRLQQYKGLEKKVSEQAHTSMSNEDFLRQCGIQLRFDFDVEKHMPRIIELVNRSNQLNYTKVRLETDQAVAEFQDMLLRHDVMSAVIFAKDRYGDHGLIGFYMHHKNERQSRLLHYVWSCRMMNAGLEQYVFERLRSPDIEIVPPIANPITVFDRIDWIHETDTDTPERTVDASHRLLLIGSCDLSAVASYTSPNRVEYVNAVKLDIMTRCDDFGFILGDPDKVAKSNVIDRLPAWGREEFASFHRDLPNCDVIIVSLAAAMKGAYLVTNDDVVVRIHPHGLGDYLDAYPWADFLNHCSLHSLSEEHREDLLRKSLEYISKEARPDAKIFILGANTRDVAQPLTPGDRAMLTQHNHICQKFCEGFANWHYVSIDAVVSEEHLVDDRHYTRIGYFAIAAHIKQALADVAFAGRAEAMRGKHEFDIAQSVRSGRRMTRFSVFGPERVNNGVVAQLKRVLNRSMKRLLA